MGVRQFVLTLTATPQALSAAFATAVPDTIKKLILQADSANVNIVRIGATTDIVSNTSFAFTLPTPITSIPAAPFILDDQVGTFSLSEIQVTGSSSATDKVRGLIVY